MKRISVSFVAGLFAVAVGFGVGRAEVMIDLPPGFVLASAPYAGGAALSASVSAFSEESLRQVTAELRSAPSVIFVGKNELRDGAGAERLAMIPRWDATVAVVAPAPSNKIEAELRDDAIVTLELDAISGADLNSPKGTLMQRARLHGEISNRSQRELAGCAADPSAQGVQQAVQVAWQASGAGVTVAVQGGDAALSECVAQRAAKWRFPWVEGEVVDASTTLLFRR